MSGGLHKILVLVAVNQFMLKWNVVNMNVVSSAIDCILRDMKWEINTFLWVFIVWNGEVREARALVVRFCNTCPKSCRFWHGQTEAHESHPKGRLVAEQFVNRRDELLIQGNILRTFPNNCKCGRGPYVRQELLVLGTTGSPWCDLSLQTKKS